MAGWSSWVGKRVAEMGFNASGGIVNWFPGHMAAATRAIRDRLKLADLVIEVRDARVSSLPFLFYFPHQSCEMNCKFVSLDVDV